MVLIAGGAFYMGSPVTEPNRAGNETQHLVAVSPFFMDIYPVTQAQYQAVTGDTPSYFKGANLPVEMVTWYDAVEFCNKLSVKEGLEPVYTITDRVHPNGYPISAAAVTADWAKNGYRLPTEAEWEFACRGDYPDKAANTATKPFGVGADNQMAYNLANFYAYYPYDKAMGGEFSDVLCTGYIGKTSVVGSYGANNYGLFDMHGNVWEWCWDWHDTYPQRGLTDYRGPDSGANRIVRGGSWYSYSRSLRSACRTCNDPGGRDSDIGFRVVRNCK